MENQYSKRIVKKRKINELYIDEDNNYDKDKKTDSNINSYILNLYYICNNDENKNIVSFYDKGGFVIKDIELFKKIVENTFRLNDYASFIRNLNNYGFVNITPRHRYDKRFFFNLDKYNVNEIIYANPYFLNNKSVLEKLCTIKCNSVHLHTNTFMKEIKDLHNKETNEMIDLLLYLKNSKNI
jgi:hypothetical protein